MRNFLLGAAMTLLLSAGGAFGLTMWAAYGDRSFPGTETTVVVPEGLGVAEIGRRLAQAGVVRSPYLFDLLVRREGVEERVHAGQFRFEPGHTLDEVVHQLVTGGAQVAVWVTFPEGYTSREIAQTLATHGLGSEVELERTFLGGTIQLDGTRTRSLEGYLFPSTYLIPVDATPRQIAQELVDQFRTELPPDAQARAKALGLTVPQVVTLASLIEREAKADDERPLMAGVYYNRLRRGMPLEVDATIEYTFPRHKDVISLADLARDSPYNTYKHTGLPPTPIANPGKPSLLAAFYPQPSDFLFYVYKGNGHHAFSRTLAEHEANIARYLH